MKGREMLRWAPFLALPLAACGAGERAGADAVVRDSAGIRIVENTADLWPADGGWRLGATPAVDIGVLDGAPEYQLYQVSGAVRLSDGRIVVANAGTHELRFYDPSGAYLSSVGREGEGPGEFRSLMTLAVAEDDSLMAFDWQLRRVSVFDAAGSFVRSFLLDPPGEDGFPRLAGAFDNRSLLVRVGDYVTPESRSGVSRDTAEYYRYSMDGEPVDTVGRFIGDESYLKADGGTVGVMSRALGRISPLALHGDHFYFGTSDTYEIGRYTADGRLELLIRKAHENLAVTPEDIERLEQERLEEVDDRFREFFERMYADMPFPETMPAYAEIEVDAEGNLWVEEYRRPADEQPRWTVFDPEGQMLGVVETPPGFEVFQIGADFVLGRWEDELEVEHVRSYALIKPSSETPTAGD